MKFPNMRYYGGPDQEETELEVAMKSCDVCGAEVPEITLKFYRDSGNHLCQDCIVIEEATN